MGFECRECGRVYNDGREVCDSDDCPNFMPIEEAIDIVYELAQQNALSDDLQELDDMYDEMRRQHLALDVVHDFAVNHLGDD